MTKDFDDQYVEFLSKHRNKISSLLEREASDMESRFSLNIWGKMDFGGKVLLPLLAAWVILSIVFAHNAEKHVIIILAVSYIALSFWLKHVWDSIPLIVCWYFFNKYQRKQIILQYVAAVKARCIQETESEDEKRSIISFYDWCSYHIVDELYEYRFNAFNFK